MKIQKRNLATIILAILCALALAIGVSFVMPKSNIKSVSAAASLDVDVRFDAVRYWSSLNSNVNRESVAYSAMYTTKPNCITLTAVGGVGSGSVNTAISTAMSDYLPVNVIAVPLILSIKVPAHTVYKLSYSISGTLAANTSLSVISDDWKPYVGSIDDITIDGYCYKSADPTNVSGFGIERNVPTTYNNYSMLMYNMSDAVATMEVYTVHIETLHLGSDGYHGSDTSKLSFGISCSATIETKLGTPTAKGDASAVFDGTVKSFDINYNTNINGSGSDKIFNFVYNSCTDVYGANPITCDDAGYNLSVSVDALNYSGVSISTYDIKDIKSGIFKATEAGTYKIKFNLTADAIANGIEWSTGGIGEKTLTFTITRKGLTVPTVTNPQEYTGSPLTFVLSDFDGGQHISMDGVTPSKSGAIVTDGNGNAYTNTTDTFKATNVGKYTVNLSLRDTNNYAWTDGTITDKTVNFEITQKELLSSSPVSSKVNNIGGAEWNYGDNTVTVTVTDDRVSGENINLLFYYDDKSHTLTNVTTTGNTSVITMPNDIAVGTHTLYVELNGTSGDNANYKLTKNNTLSFEIKSAKVDPSNYTWIYTKDGAAGGTISDGDKLPFVLKTGSAVDGVKYELSIQIPSSDSVAVDTSKYSNGYQLRSGDSVKTYKTVVALKSTDPTFQFEVNGVMQSTIDVELNWEIEKGTFDLSNVKWEYNLDGTTTWTDYDPANPPQYNDGNYITVRIKSTSLPLGLTLDSTYVGMEKANVSNYTATVSLSDLVYNNSNFNAPDVSTLTLNWEIAKKNLYVRFKNVSEPYANANYSGTFILKQLDVPSNMESYISYTYYDMATGLQVSLADIKDVVDPTNEKTYKVVATIDPAYAANYTVDDNGSSPFDTFTTGSQNELAKATVDGNDGKTAITVEYDGNTHFDSSVIAVTSDSGIKITDYTVVYYSGKTATAGNELAAGDLPKDAGDYCIQIVLGTTAARRYILERETFEIKIEAKGIAIPELGEMVFNGKELKFEDFLGGTWNDYKSIITLDGKLSDRNVGASSYVTTLTLTDSNYKWIYPTTSTPVKATAKYSLTADGVTVTGDDTVATYNWNITPLIIDTTNLWNKSKNGATLNLPQNVKDLIAGGTLEVGYRYYDSDGTLLDDVELKAGKSFKVEAAFSGDDAERNVQFKTSDTDYGSVSKSIDYTVPTSGAAAFLGNIKSFMSKTWLGLPIWAWLLIALVVLIFLIIIIAVACKRRKSKEEREEIKARKEEEKQRKEEERQRREEERQAQKERLEAERELAKAKQEAELEKIRMQAQMGAGMAGAATMAMQQPQQPVQQAQQPMPQQQPVVQQIQSDSSILAEMRAQMAEIRAENRATQAQVQAMQNMQNQQPHYAPQYAPVPVQSPAPAVVSSAPAADGNLMMLMDMKLQMAEMKSAQAVAEVKAAQAIAEAKAANSNHTENPAQQQPIIVMSPAPYSPNYPAANSGYGMPAMPAPQQLPNYGATPPYGYAPYGAIPPYGYAPVAILPRQVQTIEKPSKEVEEPQTTPSVAMSQPPFCPPGAVMTTTTTIDTSKVDGNGKPIKRTAADSADDVNFDVDGFYDPFN